MSIVDNPIKVKPIAYNEWSEPDPSIIINESFSYNNHFLILSSKPVPPTGKTYMEVTITTAISNKYFRYIPLYFGIHRDPTTGITINDCIFGSVYYKQSQDIQIFEHKSGGVSSNRIYTRPESLSAKLPITKSVIGVGVDMNTNTINLYTDGKLLYTISPTQFTIKTNATNNPWYFAIYSPEMQFVGGKINYGRYKLKYKPTGYVSMYQYYYPVVTTPYTPPVIIEPPYNPNMRADFDCKIDIENELVPIDMVTKKRYIYLNHKVEEMSIPDEPLQFKMYANRGFTAPDMTTINLPCPCEQWPVYFEINIKDAEMVKDDNGRMKYIGIPVEVGLSIKKNDYKQKSFRVCLYHLRGGSFEAYSIDTSKEPSELVDGAEPKEKTHFLPATLNPAAPVQPDTVGFLIDRKHNKITIYTAADPYCQISLPTDDIDFSDPKEIVYVFIKSADKTYNYYLRGIVNVGEDKIQAKLPEGAQTFYDYYINSIRWYITEPFPEFPCQIRVKSRTMNYISDFIGRIYIPFDPDKHWNTYDRGLNVMNKTFNKVTDTETKQNQPIISQADFKKYVDQYKNL